MLDQVNYEIEVECRNMPFVLEQRDKVFKKQPNQFSATVQCKSKTDLIHLLKTNPGSS
jgi:hypothetical protein